MSVTLVLRDRLLAVSAEAWPVYRDDYLATRAALLARGPSARQVSLPLAASTATAVVPVTGMLTRHGDAFTAMLGWSSYEALATQVEALAADRSISRIILRVESGGGSVFGVEDAAQAISAAAKRKPVIALADGLMASAAYWLASGATEIVATPGSEVGSIGVIAVHYDESAALAQAGVVATEITAGTHKGEGSPLRPLSDEDRYALTERVEAQYQLFTARVARGRKVPVEDVRAGFGSGRVLTATAALKAGLVDRIARYSDLFEGARDESPVPAFRASADADLRLKTRLMALRG